MESQETVHELLRQIWEGDDIPSPRRLLSRVKPERAAAKLPGFPYSMLANLGHTVFWQRLWLNRLRGGKRPQSITEDWRTPKPAEWPALRDEFLEGFQEVLRIAESKPFDHKMRSDERAVNTLLNLAIHNAYHLGQINVLKRALRLGKG